MNSDKRREKLLDMIKSSDTPLTGAFLSKELGVSRQVIVQDIAVLRAAGMEIFATPQGYVIPKGLFFPREFRVFACKHDQNDIMEELMTIVDLGGRIVDVVIEHPIYGEFRAQLRINSRNDVHAYMERMEKEDAEPLSSLTEGIHLHTVEADSAEILDIIEKKLDEKGFLLSKD